MQQLKSKTNTKKKLIEIIRDKGLSQRNIVKEKRIIDAENKQNIKKIGTKTTSKKKISAGSKVNKSLVKEQWDKVQENPKRTKAKRNSEANAGNESNRSNKRVRMKNTPKARLPEEIQSVLTAKRQVSMSSNEAKVLLDKLTELNANNLYEKELKRLKKKIKVMPEIELDKLEGDDDLNKALQLLVKTSGRGERQENIMMKLAAEREFETRKRLNIIEAKCYVEACVQSGMVLLINIIPKFVLIFFIFVLIF